MGRDSFFILPHLFIYVGGIGVLGAAIAGIGQATLAGPSGIRLPFGFALTAAGILVIMAAGPVDAWWHNTFGKDVLIWSPPHLQLHLGAGIAAIGLLFVVAAQRGRGAFARPGLWRGAMLAVLVDLVHRGHFLLAHYTMLPHSRTPDLYPFLVALMAPMVLVAAARTVGIWAPLLACLAFLGVAWLMDMMLRLIEYERYTLTPILAIPATAVSLTFWWAGRRRDLAVLATVAGFAFVLVFVSMEAAWMRWVVGRPWTAEGLLAGLPRALLTGALGGWAGWVLGGFLRAAAGPTDVTAEFGSRTGARRAAVAAIALAVIGLGAAYDPQRYGPPMTVAELKLVPFTAFPYQEAIFWNVFFAEGWPAAGRIEARSEGIIDGMPMPVGPAWCAPTEAAWATILPGLRFTMEVNGTPVDLAPYPLVQRRLRDGEQCAWVGVASAFQRASQNSFVYSIEQAALGGSRRIRVDLLVTFKDP